MATQYARSASATEVGARRTLVRRPRAFDAIELRTDRYYLTQSVRINRDEKVSVLLVEQNSRMALRISNRAYALTTGKVALSGVSADLVADERIRHLYLGGDL